MIIEYYWPVQDIHLYDLVECNQEDITVASLGFDSTMDTLQDNKLIIRSRPPPLQVPRIDMTGNDAHVVWTIDPEGSTDADDGFSVWDDGSHVHLMVHIADPTAYLSENSTLFNSIISKGQTRYKFNSEPEHLFPKEILERATLINGSHKKTISVHIVFEPTNQLRHRWKVVSSQVQFCTVNCDMSNRLTYEKAAEIMYTDPTILLATELAVSMWNERVSKLSWMCANSVLFNDMSLTIPKPGVNEIPVLKEDTLRVKMMKSMIAEFAIYTNTVFAKALSDNSLFLRAASLPLNFKEPLTGHDLLHKIISNNVQASYTCAQLPHDIVTSDIYTHGTSPLRRASDCIVHYILKAQALNVNCPFSMSQLTKWSVDLTSKSRSLRGEQFTYIKQETLKWLKHKTGFGEVPLSFIVNSHIKGFLNLLIINIDGMPVNIGYTLKRAVNHGEPEGKAVSLVITQVTLGLKFDEGTLPEIDKLFP